MFKLDEIKELIKIVDHSSIEQLEIENEGTRLYISKPKQQPATVTAYQAMPAQQPASVNPVTIDAGNETARNRSEQSEQANDAIASDDRAGLHAITSPMVGTFYTAPSPTAEPYVNKGDKVEENTVVCIVEAMKLMNEIEAEVKGEIVEVLVGNGELVEFGQPLFYVKRDE